MSTPQPKRILLQLDPDRQSSVFDAVVAVDAGVDQLLPYAGVSVSEATALVHGAIFTRGPRDLRNTAIFVGGSAVGASEALFRQVIASFVGPLRVSVMLDANGANTTAAAAVLVAARHLALPETRALVLAATGPVGQRVVRLLARAGADVRAASRDERRAVQVQESVLELVPDARITPTAVASLDQLRTALDSVQLVIAAGAAGARLLPAGLFQAAGDLRVAIDLNAVPPSGIETIVATDQGKLQAGVCCYGAIGVGGTKMKIHKAAIRQLFESNDQVLDAEQILAIGQAMR